MSFQEVAPQWAWLAMRTLGWRPAEFWQATPAELIGALRNPSGSSAQEVPSRELIQSIMERDAHG